MMKEEKLSERKALTAELKGETGDGRLVATFSRFSVVDHDGDVVLPSAIREGDVLLGSWNHSSTIGSVLPIGRGRITNDGTRAQIHATIFDTNDALDEFAVIKGLGPLAQYSYSFRVLEYSTEYDELAQFPGAKRILKALDVLEVSAVYAGASIDTGTDLAKGVRLAELGLTQAWIADRLRGAGQVRLSSLGIGAVASRGDTSALVDLRTI